MSEEKGIENVKELLAFGFSIGKAIIKAKEDGKVDTTDVIHLIAPIQAMIPAIDDIDELPAELSDLSEEEAEELLEHGSRLLGEVFDKEVLVMKIEAGIKFALAGLQLYTALKSNDEVVAAPKVEAEEKVEDAD